jgi:ribosomal protein L32
MVSLIQYGDRYSAPEGAPMVLRHKECGGLVDAHRICSTCGERLTARAVRAELGPGAPPAAA